MKKYQYWLTIFILLIPFLTVNSRFVMASPAGRTEANAQDRLIKGKVTASDGEVLPGVYVIIKGTKTGVITDANGQYSISIPENEVTLEFSYIGYTSQVFEITNQTTIDVVLVQNVEMLSEIVIVAYGKVKKSDLTGAVSSIKADELKASGTTSFDQALQGRASGVVVTQTSGQPGAGASIRIRGVSSILASNEPLYVVDGMLITSDGSGNTGFNAGAAISPLAAINPNDIESIEILKDASASALYGSRATNGVILITTKRGMEGKGVVNFESYYGVQQIANKLDVLNASEYAEFVNEGLKNSGIAPKYNPKAVGEGTDWQEELFRTAPVSNYQLSFTGGDKATKYSISGGYFSQQGTIVNSKYQRYSFRVNLDRDINKKLTVGENFVFSYALNNGVQAGANGEFTPTVVAGATLFNPILPVHNPAVEGGYTYENTGGTIIGNPVANVRGSVHEGNSSRILGNVYARYQFFEGLEFRTSFGIDNIYSKDNSFGPRWLKNEEGSKGSAGQGINNARTWLNENMLSFNKVIEKHRFDALLGFTLQEFESESLGAWVFDISDDRLQYHNLAVAGNPQTPNNGESKWSMVSYLGRINYGFNDKYLLTLTGRYDASSKFARGKNQWSFFPSVAFKWRLLNEEFMKSINYLSDLGLRISYGKLGNQAIGPYQSLATVRPFGQGTFNNPNGSIETYAGKEPRIYANPNLKWETTEQIDIGLDIGVFKNRIILTADYYHKRTFDLLLYTPIPTTSGFSTTTDNVGDLKNQGFDLELRTVNLSGQSFHWNTSINFSMNRNEITNLNQDADVVLTNQLHLIKGQPVGTFYGLVSDGIFQTDDDAANSPVLAGQEATSSDPKARAKAGDRKYKDLTPDGKIDEKDRTIIGNALPDFTLGLNNEVSYKSLTLSFFIQGSFGNDLYNANNTTNGGLFDVSGMNNVLSDFGRNYWTAENHSNKYPRPLATGGIDKGTFASWMIEDASYIRLKSLSLSWNFPVSVLQKVRVRSLSIYVSGTNLLTFTKYTGFDPEANAYGNSTAYIGIDQWGYPQARTYSVGLNLGL